MGTRVALAAALGDTALDSASGASVARIRHLLARHRRGAVPPRVRSAAATDRAPRGRVWRVNDYLLGMAALVNRERRASGITARGAALPGIELVDVTRGARAKPALLALLGPRHAVRWASAALADFFGILVSGAPGTTAGWQPPRPLPGRGTMAAAGEGYAAGVARRVVRARCHPRSALTPVLLARLILLARYTWLTLLGTGAAALRLTPPRHRRLRAAGRRVDRAGIVPVDRVAAGTSHPVRHGHHGQRARRTDKTRNAPGPAGHQAEGDDRQQARRREQQRLAGLRVQFQARLAHLVLDALFLLFAGLHRRKGAQGEDAGHRRGDSPGAERTRTLPDRPQRSHGDQRDEDGQDDRVTNQLWMQRIGTGGSGSV